MMTNHPNRSARHTYWMMHPRGFANEYTIGIATTAEDAQQYEAEGFKRINRETALRELSLRPHSSHQLYRGVTIDGRNIGGDALDCYTLARNIRTGRDLYTLPW